MNAKTKAYIEVLNDQALVELRGRVSVDDLARECNKFVTKQLLKESIEANQELMNGLHWGNNETEIEKREAKVKRTLDNLAGILGLNMDSRVVGVTMQITSGNPAPSGEVVDDENEEA